MIYLIIFFFKFFTSSISFLFPFHKTSAILFLFLAYSIIFFIISFFFFDDYGYFITFSTIIFSFIPVFSNLLFQIANADLILNCAYLVKLNAIPKFFWLLFTLICSNAFFLVLSKNTFVYEWIIVIILFTWGGIFLLLPLIFASNL